LADPDVAIRSVARVFSWADPMTLGNMYLDRVDEYGILYWYDDALAQEKEINAKNGK
jgi:hypothetical protein